jgi:hypothetical protein
MNINTLGKHHLNKSMHSRKLASCFTAFCFLVLLISVSAPSFAKQVEAKGVSELIEGKVVEARRIALQSAKRAAIEQTIGTFIQSRTSVSNYLIAKDSILTSTSGQIDNFSISSEGINDLGLYEVVINANVNVDAMLNEVKQIQKAFGWGKKPRVTISVESNSPAAQRALRSALTKILLKENFEVFDDKQAVYSGFVVEATLDTGSREDNYQGISLKLHELSLSLSVKRIGDQQVIASDDFSGSKAGLKANEILGGLAKTGAKKAWPSVRRQMISFWQEEQYKSRKVYIEINNASNLANIKKIAQEIAGQIPGVKSADVLSYDNKVAILLLEYRGYAEQVYDELLQSGVVRTHHIIIKSVNSNKIIADLG